MAQAGPCFNKVEIKKCQKHLILCTRSKTSQLSPSIIDPSCPPVVSSLPKTVLHAVARRRTKAGVGDKRLQRRDPSLVPLAKPDPLAHRKLVDVRTRVGKMLANSLTSSGRRRFVEAPAVVSQTNADKRPHKVPCPETIPDDAKPGETVFGNEILRLPPDAPYNVSFPIKRGDLDINSSKLGGAKIALQLQLRIVMFTYSLFDRKILLLGSESALLTDLESIWSHALESELGIDRQDFGRYRVVLIIPAVFRRALVKRYMSLLLHNMGFAAAFLTLDHICAAFGAGLSKLSS